VTEPLLEIEGLRVTFGSDAPVQAVTDVSFSVGRGEVLGIIGESGSGKTVTGLSILRLLPEYARSTAKTLRYNGKDIAGLADDAFDIMRGRELSMIFQDPVGSFNPVKSIGWHLQNALRMAAPDTAFDLELLLKEVGIHNAGRVLNSYPHQLSGGMLQRALIAMVFALRPSLIIADEPTTNLDNIVEGQILSLIRRRQQELGTSMIFITHDLTIARSVCNRIAVMYSGEIVEIGDADAITERPRHPYTAGLLKTALSLERGDNDLYEISGEPGSPMRGEVCRFSPRCPEVIASCRAMHPLLVKTEPGLTVRCIRHDR
jgi:oligopeptide/dipeptide ABC transporter ATP-binding protein